MKGKVYEFTCGAKVAVFTWQGCLLELTGKTEISYVGKETPMDLYLKCHSAMERIRRAAEVEDNKGPNVMVVGPCDVGKSTLCKLLVNYATKMGWSPMYVDLDVGQGHITVPGTIGALPVEGPSDVVHGFSLNTPLLFHFGHDKPSSNPVLYNHLVTCLAESCFRRLQAHKKEKASGVIINTCGWTQQEGCKLLAHASRAFNVHVILVLDQERLCIELARDIPSAKVVSVPRSSGVTKRSESERNEARDESIRRYFYGLGRTICSQNIEMKWKEIKLFKILGTRTLPSSCMPSDVKAKDNPTKLLAITPDMSIVYRILSVSCLNHPPEHADFLRANIIGFACV